MKIYNLLWVLVLCIFFNPAKAQTDIKGYVESNIHVIRTIDPDSSDYADLDAIGTAIGNSRIVMLGEQDHGDAPTFQAKARLIKYLHECRGFNVLAFESDFFGLNYMWPQVLQGQLSLDTSILTNVYSVWTMCGQCKPFFHDYLRKTTQSAQPLHITGFDNNMSTVVLSRALDSIIRALDLPISHQPDYATEIFPQIQYWYKNANDTARLMKAVDILRNVRSQMLTKLDKDDFWVLTVENIIQLFTKYTWKNNYWKTMNTRDAQMAANLRWLAYTRYSKEKIIVWAHNYHVSKYGGHYPEGYMNEGTSMSTIFTSDSVAMADTYVIGFTGYDGTAGRITAKPYSISRPTRNSFENWGLADHAYAFVDFGPYNRQHTGEGELFNMSASVRTPMLHTNSAARWNKVFDGVFFIKTTYLCDTTH